MPTAQMLTADEAADVSPKQKTTTLYHGTVERVAKLAPSQGIRPYSVPHHTDEPAFSDEQAGTITLTTVYAAYQAFMAALPDKRERWAIIELRVDRLYDGNLQPCTAFLKRKEKDVRTWEQSLERSGLCLHTGRVPAAAVSKVWVYDPLSNWLITRSVLHTQLGATAHETRRKELAVIHRWLTGEFVTATDWLAEQTEQYRRAQEDALRELWQDRSGLDRFYLLSSE